MDEYIKEISEKIEDKKEYYAKISDKIWEYAEPRFQEYKSSELLQQTLKKEGFSIKSNLAGEETAFIAEYGSGKPVIGFLGEFDALPGLSQKADTTERIPEEKTSDSKYESVPEREKKQNPGSGYTDNCGHGCGHQLIGTGTLAAVIALKDFMKAHNLKGTIRYYGCPAEENAGGKAFLVRDGYFNDCDLALCWHPEQGRRACYGSTKANFRVFFTFYGTPAHASMCPELGRSALDAVELMDVGVNYMREHMIDEARIHYAITDTGGDAPNVVQSRAQVLYAIRAPKITQVKELYNRVCNIAKGAALMTETTVEIRQVAAYSNLISSKILADHMNTYLEKLGPIPYTEQEYAYAQKFQQSLSDQDKNQL
ncbi:amidohydrolase, partial [Blautia wexlerae]